MIPGLEPEYKELPPLMLLSFVYTHRAINKLRKGDDNGAIQDCNIALEIYPNSSFAYGVRSSAYSLSNEFQKAIDDVWKAIHIDPYFYFDYTRLARCEWKLGN